ncbi:hypothetical protein C0992_009263, partial [Termitomyces sp. T32_za158]
CWAIDEVEDHYQQFKQPTVGLEHCLLLVSLLDAHIVVAPLDIQTGEVAHILEVVDELRDEWK